MTKQKLYPEDRNILVLEQVRLKLVLSIAEIDKQILQLERLKKMRRGK